MTVRAVIRDGREVEIAPEDGLTIEEMQAKLTAGTLTGSAVPLADAKLRTVTGEEVAYVDIQTFAEDSDFLTGEA